MNSLLGLLLARFFPQIPHTVCSTHQTQFKSITSSNIKEKLYVADPQMQSKYKEYCMTNPGIQLLVFGFLCFWWMCFLNSGSIQRWSTEACWDAFWKLQTALWITELYGTNTESISFYMFPWVGGVCQHSNTASAHWKICGETKILLKCLNSSRTQENKMERLFFGRIF